MSANIATTGLFRFANTETFAWRNAANSEDVSVQVNASDELEVSGAIKGDSTINAVTGYRQNGSAASGNVLRGNGTNFVSAQLAAGDLSNGTIGSGAVVLATGAPTIIATLSLTGQTANFTNQQVIASLPATGIYRITGYTVVTTADGVSSTLPSTSYSFTEPSGGGVGTGHGLTGTSTGNTVGGTNTSIGNSFQGKVGTAVTVSSASYASNTPNTMTYSAFFILERLL